METAHVGEDAEKKEHLRTTGGNVTQRSHFAKQYGGGGSPSKT